MNERVGKGDGKVVMYDNHNKNTTFFWKKIELAPFSIASLLISFKEDIKHKYVENSFK